MPIRSDGKRYFLEGQKTAYVLAVRNDKLVEHLYWGPKLPLDTDYPAADRKPSFAFENPQGLVPLEYPTWGGLRFSEPCLKVEFPDGCRDTRLVFEDATYCRATRRASLISSSGWLIPYILSGSSYTIASMKSSTW
ncbi:MAG: hypothetical protein IMX00_02355 [Limnochordales bacterium]|nr:hypothetical protein [Limnochordales bacterium]